MPLITWSAKYQTGNREVDTQHQELFRMVNYLHDGITAGKGRDVMEKTLDDLASYVVKHFKTEENLMVKEAYPDYARHKSIHDKLTKDAVDIITGYKSGKLILSVTLSKFLREWLQVHIEGEDIKMIDFVKTRNSARLRTVEV